MDGAAIASGTADPQDAIPALWIPRNGQRIHRPKPTSKLHRSSGSNLQPNATAQPAIVAALRPPGDDPLNL